MAFWGLSVSLPISPSLTLMLAPHSEKEPYDYTGPTRIIQDNLPSLPKILNLITSTKFLLPYISEHIQRLECRHQWVGTLFSLHRIAEACLTIVETINNKPTVQKRTLRFTVVKMGLWGHVCN